MEERVLADRYRLITHLARGGMAEVYVADDQLLNRRVAVKVLFPELARDEAFVERFRREARAAASLNHRNIVSVYDFGEGDGSWFIVMEYVEGRTLRDVIRVEGAMDPPRATELAAEIAAALVASHERGIIHRDVKPANVLIASGTGTVKVADFGIARAANTRENLTMPGTVLGTATYLSPEQAQGGEIDARTDVYSLGLVLYEMLTGAPPFTGSSPVAVAYKQLKETAPPPSTRNERVRPALDALVMKALAKEPAARQASAAQLRSELLAIDEVGAAGGSTTDPGATAVNLPPQVAPAEATSVLASPRPPVRRTTVPVAPGVYRRRRAGLIALVGLVGLVVLALIALSDGGDTTTVAVPGVVDRTVAEATALLGDAGLTSRVVEREAPETQDRVVDQAPGENAQVARGTQVRIFVPTASPTPTTTPPAPTSAPVTAATTPTTVAATTTVTQAPTTTGAPTTTAPATTTTVPTSSQTSTT